MMNDVVALGTRNHSDCDRCDEDGDVLAPELLLCPCCDDVLEFTTTLMMEHVGMRATLLVINLLCGCVV